MSLHIARRFRAMLIAIAPSLLIIQPLLWVSAASPPAALANTYTCDHTTTAGDSISYKNTQTSFIGSQSTVTVSQLNNAWCDGNSWEYTELDGPDNSQGASEGYIWYGYFLNPQGYTNVFTAYRNSSGVGNLYTHGYTNASDYTFQIGYSSGCGCFRMKYNTGGSTWTDDGSFYVSTNLGWSSQYGVGAGDFGNTDKATGTNIGGFGHSNAVGFSSNNYADSNGTWHGITWPVSPYVDPSGDGWLYSTGYTYSGNYDDIYNFTN